MMEDKEVLINLVWIDHKDWIEVDPYQFFSAAPWQARANLIKFTSLSEPAILQSSYSAESGWKTVNYFVPNTASYLDVMGNTSLYLNSMLHYRLLLPNSKRKTKVVKVQEQDHGNKIAAEISRRHRIMLEQGLNGEPGYAFIKHRDGVRCPNCWDDILQQRVKNDCGMCLNTGWDHGYYDAIKVYFSSSPNLSAIQPSLDGNASMGNTQTAWLSNYPLLSTGDLLIAADDWAIWAVDSNNQTFHKGVMTRQSLNLSIVQGNDPRRKIIERLRSEL